MGAGKLQGVQKHGTLCHAIRHAVIGNLGRFRTKYDVRGACQLQGWNDSWLAASHGFQCVVIHNNEYDKLVRKEIISVTSAKA